MNEKLINLKKLSKIAWLAFENGLRLHFDSILLYKSKSFPSAFHTSVLAMEEFGKSISCDFVVFYTSSGDTRDSKLEMEWLKSLYNHPQKQIYMIGHDWTRYDPKFLKMISERGLEFKKQNAIYVGLKRVNGKIDILGKVSTPLKLKSDVARTQISVINDYLRHLCEGKIGEWLSIDNDEIAKMVNQRLLKKLKANWKFRGRKYSKSHR